MKKNTRRNVRPRGPLAQLGGLTATQFLRDYWQKKPLLIRQAFASFEEPLTKQEVIELAQRDDAESRVVVHAGRQWQLRHGPFSKRDFAALRNSLWTVLIQDTQHFSQEAHDVLARFSFIPHARVDDLMVSYAVPGAGVGAHVDSYDVFLLQGSGKRRWQISSQSDLRLKEDVPLKILARFKAEHEYLLETGDMLYLPPGYAHHGVAETECLTWSIGFRAPSQQELSTALLDHLRDEVHFDGQYRDPDLRPSRRPGEINAAMTARMERMLAAVSHAARDKATLRRFLGGYLTEPKSHVYFDAPEPRLGLTAFSRRVKRDGARLDLKTRLLYLGESFFLNGVAISVGAADRAAWRQLADARELPGRAALSGSKAFYETLHRAYCDGYLHPDSPRPAAPGGRRGP